MAPLPSSSRAILPWVLLLNAILMAMGAGRLVDLRRAWHRQAVAQQALLDTPCYEPPQ